MVNINVKLNTFSLLMLLASLVNPVIADPPVKTHKYGYKHKMIINACGRYISSNFKFGYQSAPYYKKMCSYEPHLGSIFICSAEMFEPYSKVFNKSVHYSMSLCQKYRDEKTFEEYLNIYENSTQYALEYDSSLNYTNTKLYQPIIINSTIITPQYRYTKSINYNFDEISFFASFYYWYFLFVFLLFGITSLIQRVGFHTKFKNKAIDWYRSSISIPTLFNNGRHTESFTLKFKFISALIPSRVETVVIFFYTCLNIFLGVYNYDFEYHPSSTIGMFIWRNVADRTALLAFGQIPLLILFAGRNNILTTLTNIPYTSLIVYHKCVARFMYIHAVIHSVGWTVIGINNKSLAAYYSRIYFRWGAVATVCGGIILFQAFHFFRTASYETFLIMHIALVILFIAACFHHCYTIGYLEWIYVSIGVWGLDRIIRCIRIAMNGIQKAEIQYVGDDTFKVEVPHTKWFNPFPGSYAFLYFMSPLTFWQSHPFTLLKSVNKKNHICFYIKAKTGLTRTMINNLQKEPNGTKTVKVLIEGPYGHRAPTHRYDKALIYAGGNGIPGPFAHVFDLASRESINKQQVKFLWTIRNIESLNWFYDELKVMTRLKGVEMDIYITGKNHGMQAEKAQQAKKAQQAGSSSDMEKNNEKHYENDMMDFEIKQEMSGQSNEVESEKYFSSEDRAKEIIYSLSDVITFHYQRPNVDELILREFSEDHGPSVCVMSCGPPKMVDQIRNSVAKHLSTSKGRVDLFEELQTW